MILLLGLPPLDDDDDDDVEEVVVVPPPPPLLAPVVVVPVADSNIIALGDAIAGWREDGGAVGVNARP